MKKFTLSVFMVLFAVATMLAQRTVSGTVLDQDGEAMIGVNISVKGTNVGTISDLDGNYSVEIPDGAGFLVFSYTGFSTQEVEIGAGNVIDISLTEGVLLNEAVVTALGIERDEKAIGYSVQQLDGEDLSMARDQNVASALSGKVAGVQVISASGASLGGTSKIRIRGANSLEGGSPLFVVDGTPVSNANFSAAYRGIDFGNLASDINPDDIESISVLKGPSAAALYGNRGANGVIMIKTKTGSKRKGIGVSINSSVTTENVYVLPEYQNEYAGGYTQDFIPYVDPVDGQTYNTLNYSADESWGPRIDGTNYRPWWSWYAGDEYGQEVPLTAQPDNIRNFFDSGLTFNNSVALSGGNDNTTFRLSYNNVNAKGIIPGSGLKKNNIGINAMTKLTDRLSLTASVNLATNEGIKRPTFGYTTGNVIFSFNQWWQRQLDIDRLRDYRNPDGTFRSWNIRSPENLRPLYWNSPFFDIYEDQTNDKRDRFFGYATLAYEISDHLTLSGSVRRDNYTFRYNDRIATGGLDQDRYQESVRSGNEDNYDFRLGYDNNFGDISLDASLGGNIRKNVDHNNFLATQGGLTAANLFNLRASTDRPTATSSLSEKEVRSVYASANFGYKSMFYLSGSVRNDWSSALPEANNSYLYPGISTSFVFSELMNSSILSFGKIRASWAQTGSDIDPYRTSRTFTAGTPYGSTGTFNLPNTLINEDLRPALTSSYEVGLDLRFLNNRIGLDVTYYDQHAKDQILTLPVPGSSGNSLAIINAGDIQSSGIEIALNATPIVTKNFSWDFSFNLGKNDSKVIELAEGIENRRLDSWGWGGLSINAPVGGEWGEFRGRGYSTFEDTGIPIITEDGLYVKENNKELGGVLPDFTGGFRNTFKIFGFHVGAFIDFQSGGQFHSVTSMFNAYSGLSTVTAGLNDKGNPVRDPVSEGGGVFVEGVLADGTPHSTYADAQSLYEGNLFALNERWLFDASYVKLREISIGYDIPAKLIKSTPLQSASVSLIGRNLWLIHSNAPGIDPSEISPGSNAYVFQENGQLPGVRSFGINLKLGF